MADAALRHISSALSRLTDGGRLVAITGANCAPDNPAWTDAFVRLAGTRPRRFLGGDRRRGLCETRHDHRHAADRDRQNSRRRSDGVPGVAWRGARCGDIARLDHAILNRQGCRRLPVSSRQLSPNRLSRALRARSWRVDLRFPLRPSNPKPSNSPMRRSTGSRSMAAASPMRSMRNTRFSRYAFPAQRLTPPSWCNRRRWPRSRRPSRAIDRICPPGSSRMACCRTRRLRASFTPARPMPASSPDHGTSTRPSTSSPPRPTTPRTPFAFAEAGSSATAPAPARAAKSLASCSTIGSRAAAARSGFQNPTS